MSPALLAVGGAVAVAMVLSRLLTRRLSVPDAIPLVVLGVVAGYLPGVPPFHIDPQIIFLGFLPALVYHAGFFTAPRETRDNAVPIALLAVGLVFATAAVLGVTVHLVLPELGWAPAFVLGAILSPTDPVAATAVLRRFGAPRRITTILEGESLVNDGVALTLFAVALHAVGRPVGAGDVVVRFVIEAAGGVAYGLVVGWVVGELRSRIKDTPAQMVVSLATPYLAYLPADRFGASGVLAAVSAGFFLGTRRRGVLQAESRLQATAFWDVLAFLLESVLFVLLGLELHTVVDGVADRPADTLAAASAAVVGAMVLIRIVYELGIPPLQALAPGSWRGFTRLRPRERLVIGWAGLRGAISFAAALSVPALEGGHRFPARDLVVFLTIVAVLFSLFGQGLTLPLLLRTFRLSGAGQESRERLTARRALLETALQQLDGMTAEQDGGDAAAADEIVEVLRRVYESRLSRLEARDAQPGDEADGSGVERSPGRALIDVQLPVISAQRATLEELYRSGEIGQPVRRRLQHALDVEETRLRGRA